LKLVLRCVNIPLYEILGRQISNVLSHNAQIELCSLLNCSGSAFPSVQSLRTIRKLERSGNSSPISSSDRALNNPQNRFILSSLFSGLWRSCFCFFGLLPGKTIRLTQWGGDTITISCESWDFDLLSLLFLGDRNGIIEAVWVLLSDGQSVLDQYLVLSLSTTAGFLW
jgi:hypothetical protein